MGLKTTNYLVEEFDINLPNAYARLANVSIDVMGEAVGIFKIYQNREDSLTKSPIDSKVFRCEIDKEQLIHKQVYDKAKEVLFVNWEDDIVE